MFLFQAPLFSDVIIYHPGLHVLSKVKNSYNMKNITNSTSFELMTIRYSSRASRKNVEHGHVTDW